MLELSHLLEFDPAKKDYDWMNKQITRFRQSWGPIVDEATIRDNLSFMFGTQDLAHVRRMFTEPSNAGLHIIPIALLEKAKNIFTAEVQEYGIHVHVKAVDPTAFNEKDRDRELLSNRKVIETIVSAEQQSIGGPPFRLADEKEPNGQPVFKGNIQDFDEMGLDENSSEDVGYFFKFWHRLNYETKAEEPIMATFKANEVDNMLELFVLDVLTKKAVASQCYVSDTTGGIEHRYLNPMNVRSIKSKNKNYKDAPVLGYEERCTVSEFLRMVGSEFDAENDIPKLMTAVSLSTSTIYSGVREDGCMRCGTAEGTVLEWNDMLRTEITYGYMEFRTNNATALRKTTKNYHGNLSVRVIPVSKDVSSHSIYTKEVYFNEVIYKAYYLALGASDQKLYKAGPLSFQSVEGADDEIAGFSTSVYVEQGPTFVQIAKPFVTMWTKAFYKMEFEVNRSKPTGRSYNLDSILAIADALSPKDRNKPGAKWDGVMKVLKMFKESPDEMHVSRTAEGDVVGGGAMSSSELRNGLSETVLDFMKLMDWADAMINQLIGISPQRDVYTPKPREASGLQDVVTGFSQKATQYIQRMINNLLVGMGTRTLALVQDVIAFKDKNTLAYKNLLTRMGDQTMEDLEALNGVALHRYGIHTEWADLTGERNDIKVITYKAMDKGEISAEQVMLINSIRSPKRAAQILAQEKMRSERNKAKDMQAQNQALMERDKNLHRQRMELADLQGQYDVKARDAGGRWLYESRRAENEARLQERGMKVDSDTQRIGLKADADIKKIEAVHDLNSQQAAPIGE